MRRRSGLPRAWSTGAHVAASRRHSSSTAGSTAPLISIILDDSWKYCYFTGMAVSSAAAGSAERAALAGRVRVLSWVTLVWLGIDGVVGMTAGITANSVALIGWGADCGIQAAAALVIIWRFSGERVHSGAGERRAQKVVAVSFLLLVPYIVVVAIDQLVSGKRGRRQLGRDRSGRHRRRADARP